MKILLAYISILPFTGGVWTYVRELKNGLEKLGHSVDILAWNPDMYRYYKMEKNDFIELQAIRPQIARLVDDYYDENTPKVDRWIRSNEIHRYTFEIASAYLGLDKYDIIHAQCVRSARAISRVKPKHVPLVTSPHSYLTKELFLPLGKHANPTHKRYISHLEFLGPTSSDHTIVASKYLKGVLEEFGVTSDSISVVPYGIDIEKFSSHMENAISSQVPPTNKKIIICPARVEYEKGHLYLLEALAMLKANNITNWVCWIAGIGEYLNELKGIAIEFGIHNDVVFLEERSDIPALLKRADIFALPSLLENLPFAVMEAQLAGKAIVVSDEGGIPEMITHGVTGMISPTYDSEGLSQNLKLVLSNEAIVKQLGKNAKQFAFKSWPIDLSVTRTLAIYENVINQKKKGAFNKSNNHSRFPFKNLVSQSSRSFWDSIFKTLPEDYLIPDPGITTFLKNLYK
ncbi:glycosyltransferase family 4 protein [Bacillus timonensis]|uniref:glycosyltransferase family 4 protein n=1 Tax=Bacillus timonensis TaxID=1033734 RepID=UPI00028925B1|nr:glycosyltransferase family 4 protein [Bacillus timonensis]